MSITVQVADTEDIRLTENTVETHPPDRLEFSVRGQLTVTEALLVQFEGATLNPVRVTVSDDGEPAEIELTEPPSLRLETADIGVATPESDDIADGLDALRPSTDGGPEPIDARPDVITFTVDGTIRGVPVETLETTADDSPAIESVTFAVEESVMSDGGSGSDVIFELTLLGYGIVVRRDGTIVVGSHGGLASIDRP